MRSWIVLCWGCVANAPATEEAVTCSDCASGEACYAYSSEDDTTFECVAAAEGCEASCDDECRGLLYNACDEGTYGTGCSEGDGAVIVSCTEETAS